MTEPTNYDLIQDGRLDALDDLVTPYYQPPGDQEYSFPVVGQGVSSEMFQQISRAAGTGVYVQHDAEGAQSPYRLTGMPGGDSETNAQNTMMLRTPSVTGRSEAAIEGFFHAQLEDITVSFPPVSTSTTYYLALTYDPRREEEESGPIHIEVHANDLPTTHGRKHIVLYTVHREPNQLLSQATISQVNPWLGHVINVWYYDHLPEPTSVEYGTLAVVINPGLARGKGLYTNRGIHGWEPVLSEPWVERQPANGWTRYDNDHAPLRLQRAGNRVFMSGFLNKGNSRQVFQTSQALAPRYDQEFTVNTGPDVNGHARTGRITVRSNNWVELTNGYSAATWLQLDGISYVLD